MVTWNSSITEDLESKYFRVFYLQQLHACAEDLARLATSALVFRILDEPICCSAVRLPILIAKQDIMTM